MEAKYHVLPKDDLVEHMTNDDCVCGPTADFGPGRAVVMIHHSLDRREDQPEKWKMKGTE